MNLKRKILTGVFFWSVATLAAFGFAAAIVYGQEVNFKPVLGPQVVLVVDHSTDGKMWVMPKNPVHFVLTAADPENHPAPLPNQTNMLCRAYDFHDAKGTFMRFRCGMDDYLVYAIGISAEKEK